MHYMQARLHLPTGKDRAQAMAIHLYSVLIDKGSRTKTVTQPFR